MPETISVRQCVDGFLMSFDTVEPQRPEVHLLGRPQLGPAAGQEQRAAQHPGRVAPELEANELRRLGRLTAIWNSTGADQQYGIEEQCRAVVAALRSDRVQPVCEQPGVSLLGRRSCVADPSNFP